MKRLALAAAFALAAAALPAAATSVGQPAPDFSAPDLQGKPVKLSDFKGKYVVLEWVNPECPYVRRHYNSGNMPELQKEVAAKDVVWLAINSSNPVERRVQDAGRDDEVAAARKAARPGRP